MKIYLKIEDGIITKATFEGLRLRLCHCVQFHGDGADYRKAAVPGRWR